MAYWRPLPLENNVGPGEAHYAGREHADESWNQEAVVDHVLTDVGGARTIKTDGREI